MDSEKDTIKIMISDEADGIKNRYQNNIESMRGSDFVFDYVHLMYYKCHKINLNCGGSYIDSPDWIKSSNKSHQ